MEKTLLEVAYKAMDKKQAEDLLVIDMRQVNPFVDYFIIGSASNYRKANSIVEEVIDECDKNGFEYNITKNNKDSLWLLCDLKTVVCHIFVGSEREKYNLEGLWKDLPIIKM